MINRVKLLDIGEAINKARREWMATHKLTPFHHSMLIHFDAFLAFELYKQFCFTEHKYWPIQDSEQVNVNQCGCGYEREGNLEER